MAPFFYYVQPLLKSGFGYGNDSKPSFDDQAKVVGDELVAAVENLMMKGHVLTVIGRMKDGSIVNDDGCGDGRAAVTVFEGSVTHRYSLNRPKVFGGGAMMTAAMLIGLGLGADKTLFQAFDEAMKLLDDQGVNYGGHTDNHADESHSGCGAIDNAPVVLSTITRFRDEIKKSILGLGLGFEAADIDAVIDNFDAYAKTVDGSAYNGKTVMQHIIMRGKVVKELDGSHRELFVLLNTVRGMTADQALIRDATGGKAQIFNVDVWRLQELADALYSGTEGHTKALISELVYTLGVAATLTRGDLPVYLTTPNPEFILATPTPAYA